MSHPTTFNGTGGEAQHNEQLPAEAYSPQALVGSLMDEDEEPIPLLYFTSFYEAWVSTSAPLRSPSPATFSAHYGLVGTGILGKVTPKRTNSLSLSRSVFQSAKSGCRLTVNPISYSPLGIQACCMHMPLKKIVHHSNHVRVIKGQK
jgi:hypothetical protein